MGSINAPGYNAIIYMTYVFLLFTGLLLAWKYGKQSNFLSSNNTQRGLPLAVNFIASGMF
ncbi:urea transport protein [Candidozyma auris]|uniref:Urea transport protein n=1 Tax=Candidozyma auris TaxID=498019 RepID=A0A0L0NRL5_CANAR|nr:urea transport protein [[Candida] auris]